MTENAETDTIVADDVSTAHALLGLHAQTPLHPGSGTALGMVDLPIQRERHTDWPTIPGSAIKGVARDACRDHHAAAGKISRKAADRTVEKLRAAFGPETEKASDFAGALSLTDARLLAFPVRSMAGVFASVTCPSVLRRLGLDLALAGSNAAQTWPTLSLKEDEVIVPADDCPLLADRRSVVLEEFVLDRKADASFAEVADWIAANLLPAGDLHKPAREHFRRTLAVIHDNQFQHFVKYATEIVARVRLDYDTKTVADGALFYEEFLPPETLFYAVVLAAATRPKAPATLSAGEVLGVFEESLRPVLQIGGNQTTGKGFCFTRLTRLGA